MNKTLTIIRHAKAGWPDDAKDYDRPLLERGISDAQIIGRYLNDQNYSFDAVLCSGARRARQTLKNLQTELSIDQKKIHFNEDLYMTSVNSVTKKIEGLPNSLNWVAIVGHNPTLTELCNYLTNDNLSNLPTCGVYTISFPFNDWQAIGPGSGNTVSLVTPKMLKY